MTCVNCLWILLISVVVSLVKSKQVCEFEDTVCMTKAAKNAFKKVISGIKGLIEPTDILRIEEIKGEIAPDFKYELKNATMKGINDCRVTELRANRKSLVFDFGLICPKQVVNYDFIAKGGLGTKDVDKKGQTTVTMEDYLIKVEGKYGGFVSEIDNELRMYLASYNIAIEARGGATFEYKKLTNEDIEKSDLPEAYINRDVKEIEKSLRFVVIEAFMRQFMEKVNTYFKAYPVVELITV